MDAEFLLLHGSERSLLLHIIQNQKLIMAALQPNQTAIDALAADIKAKSDGLAAAVAANTPATPPAAA